MSSADIDVVLWMLRQAAIPFAIGAAMALTLGRFSRWSRRAKVRAGVFYDLAILASLLFPAGVGFSHDWLAHRAVQLQGGVALVFGVGVAMSLLRQAETWKGRTTGALFLVLFLSLLFLGFQNDFRAFFHWY